MLMKMGEVLTALNRLHEKILRHNGYNEDCKEIEDYFEAFEKDYISAVSELIDLYTRLNKKYEGELK